MEMIFFDPSMSLTQTAHCLDLYHTILFCSDELNFSILSQTVTPRQLQMQHRFSEIYSVQNRTEGIDLIAAHNNCFTKD